MSMLTEEDAAFAFSRAWNRLEPDLFLTLLAPEARYASQWVFDELVGSTTIAEYLRGKMNVVKSHANNASACVRVEIGRANGRPCALMAQGISDEAKAAVLFDVGDGKVVRYDLCIPQVVGAEGTGLFPE